jgi:RNA polymerase sigma-70 factor, ECF subfamily
MFDHSPAAAGLPEMSDADLLRMHTEGNKDAFGVLYQRHRSRLWAVAARIAGGQDADDVLQNAMLLAYRRAGGFRGDSAVTTWLHRIVVNAALDVTRRRPKLASQDREPSCAAWPSAEADTRMDVQKQWLRLSPDHRAALLLVDMMGYPVAEAAAIIGVSEGAMKSRAFRARAALADKLQAQGVSPAGSAGSASDALRPAGS